MFLAVTQRGISTLTVCRSIMLAGHETTAKAVGILSSVHPLDVVLTDSLADLYTLGVG